MLETNLNMNENECSSDEDISNEQSLSEELMSLRSVIVLTRDNIDALNDKFANLRDPPQMWVLKVVFVSLSVWRKLIVWFQVFAGVSGAHLQTPWNGVAGAKTSGSD